MPSRPWLLAWRRYGAALPARAAEPARAVYLNFSDGTENLTQVAVDDAPTNGSSVGMATPYPAFNWPSVATGATTRGEVVGRVVRQVHEIFLPYNVVVTTTRPASGPYTMVLIGGSPRDIGVDLNVAGLAYMDCGDQQKSNVVFAFSEAVRSSERGLATTIAQEAGHAFGLEHTAARRDIMHPTIDPLQAGFLDEEVPLLGDRRCGPATQNSHRRLLEIVGAWAGEAKPIDDGTRADRNPPRVDLSEPADGGLAAPLPQPVTIRAEVSDEGGIDRVVLMAAGERSVLFRPPFRWSLAGLPAGPLTVTVTAVDSSGNPQVVTRELLLLADHSAAPALGCSAAGSLSRERRGARYGNADANGCLLLLAVALGLGWRTCVGRRRPL